MEHLQEKNLTKSSNCSKKKLMKKDTQEKLLFLG